MRMSMNRTLPDLPFACPGRSGYEIKSASISYPESTGSLVSGASPGETLGQWNFCARNRGAAVVMRMLASKTEVKMSSQSASCRNGKKRLPLNRSERNYAPLNTLPLDLKFSRSM